MQALIDQLYPGDRPVKLSQMPDENKLILSNISGQSPDLALGINHWIPYDFASRDAALDLRQFPGYTDLVKDFAKGAMIPYVFEQGVYGLPLTQNFWVTFYRRDIMASIGIEEIPQTWDEVIGILPLLQSYGLNYFLPLSQFSGLKPFVATLPFIHQFGGQLYAENGMSTTINSEDTLNGITLMAELYTLYNIPKFVASFYNQFRYGTLPIGIGDLGTYLLLSSAASELDGLWSMDLHPGFRDPVTNQINRSAASGAQSSMILANTNHRQDSWDFLSWWMSTPIQALFGNILQSTYGKTFFWNSANLEAFAQSSMPQQYKEVVLEQWEYALEASRIPGTYMVERELSNAWTNIVFYGMNPRQAIDEAVRISNREIIYKMAEFGYTFQGQILKPYPVPTIDNIDEWLVAYA
jgi:ABC-type glycerol-3-phosphate transport system substrate-binding protein